ncbi:arrestin [Xylariaceae sp. FL0016]|nr:arrestin [Xylariaceae sp. FL0016]
MGTTPANVANLSSDDPPPKTSFFARLASPLRSRSRNLADFHIKLKEPHRQYSAGDHVRGCVILSAVKPIRLTHLTVSLHGFVRVYKNAGAAAQLGPVNPALASHDGNRKVRYHGNGHASLFQDEQVLCGEGRLDSSRWEFEFDLLFPEEGLPSSIDFERGTISYTVTATLTRPTSIAPTSSCETKVTLIEKVDIGLLTPPRERKVFLQTLKKRPKRRKPAASTVAASARLQPPPTETSEPASDRDSTRANENSNSNSNDSSVNVGEPMPTTAGPVSLPRSPRPIDVQSEVSGESAVSNNSGSNSGRGLDASGESLSGSKKSGGDTREITATVEVLKGGCLPGDLVPVKIRVEHNRYMKSLHGIIVTFYRQGRVDYAPPLSLFADVSKEDAKQLDTEEYYPKSRTGLGGLSLSSVGSCSVFRKDLSQAVAPLIIDPATLTATITTSIRVPEDVFPSIKTVPGGLISFKYHVEVVVDLGGKLAGPSAGSSQQQGRGGSMSHPTTVGGTYGIDLKRLANWNGTIVDTDHLRRERGVISVSFEVVVGTTDSTRSHGKAVVRPTLTVQPPSQQGVPIEEEDYTWQNEQNGGFEYNGDYDTTYLQHSPHGPPHGRFPSAMSPQTSYYDFQGYETQAPIYIPPPERPNEAALTDKERVRKAEERLLPSQPSQPSASGAGPSQPLAPSDLGVPTDNGIHDPSAPSAPVPLEDSIAEEASAPTLADLSQQSTEGTHMDDKQELERRRLLEEASAPPDMPEDFDVAGPSAPPANIAGPSNPEPHEPSAPTLHEHDGYGHRDPMHAIPGPSAPTGGAEPLPKYER